MDSDYDYIFKILLVGDTGVGKSRLLLRFTDDTYASYENHVATIGVDFRVKTLKIDDKIIKLQIWDTAGMEKFRTITSSYYRGAHGVIVVFDCTKQETFNNVQRWLREVGKYGSTDINTLLVGNKIDLVDERCVASSEVQTFANKMNISFLETSAKDSTNVKNAFITMTEEIILRQGFQVCGRTTDDANPSLIITNTTNVEYSYFSYC